MLVITSDEFLNETFLMKNAEMRTGKRMFVSNHTITLLLTKKMITRVTMGMTLMNKTQRDAN